MMDGSTPRHRELFDRFVELAALGLSERDARLHAIEADDPGLARELRALLDADTGEAVLDRQPSAGFALSPVATTANIPNTVGPFEVLELIGRGGMGSVYRACQQHPERTVALKLVRASLLAPDAARRLRFEGDVLARLTHPNIARIYDAGTIDDGGAELSYFAMELVEGVRITDAARRLPILDRVRLLADVCDGVHHAHQRGVIHRDLKPANILVDSESRPRILDFGIARLLEPGVQVTSAGYDSSSLAGTIAYMSPEQLDARNDAVDTRSDVYALGAVLFEMLTGRPPVQVAGMTLVEAVHAARACEIPRPRRFDPSIPRDLETVTLKALERDMERRYGSASELAADLRRVLAHEPVHARTRTLGYRAARFVHRNPGLCAAGALAAVLLVAAFGGIAYGYTQSAQRVRALEQANAEIEAEAQKAVAVNDFLRRMLVSADPLGETGVGRADMTVVEMLDRESGQIEQAFAGLPASEASVRSTIGGVYLSLGMHDRAEPHLRRSAELHDQLWSSDTDGVDRAHRDLAVLLARTDRTDEAVEMFRRVVASQEHAGRQDSTEHAITATRLGAILLTRRDYAEAETWLRRAVPILERAGTTRADALPVVYNNLARALSGQGKREEAEQLYRRAQTGFASVYGNDHATVAIAEGNIAAMRAARGELEGAVESYRRVIALLTPVMGADHPQVAANFHNLAFALYDLGRFEEALDELNRATEIYRGVYGEDHPETLTTRMAAADTLMELGRLRDAADVYRDVADRLEARDPDDARAHRARFYQGYNEHQLGDQETGKQHMRPACASTIELRGEGHPAAQRMLRLLAGVLIDDGRPDEARAFADRLDPAPDANRALLHRLADAP